MGTIQFKRVIEKDELEEVFRLRYKVYCDEKGFERPEDHPGGLERDQFDSHSLHFIATNDTNQVVATMRLILNSEKGFPIEKHCEIGKDLSSLDRSRVGEISRLVVSKEYCRRTEDTLIYSSVPKLEVPVTNAFKDRRRGQGIVIGLYKLIYIESKKIGITHWFAVMAKGLNLLLKKMGIIFIPVGPEVDYHGLRTPYLGSIEEIEAEVSRVNPDLFKQAREEMKRSL